MTLKDYRVKRGFTQEQTAEALNITLAAYSYYEKGQRRIPKDIVDKLINLFRITKKDANDIFLPTNFTICDDGVV